MRTEDGDGYAIWVTSGEEVERHAAVQSSVEPLIRFYHESEFLRSVPETDKDIVRGPRVILNERRLPRRIARDLLQKKMVETVTIRVQN
ncbi:MAG: hypothetical protein HY473_01705 [Candidatus Sungbacteria bacterium]|uniref:Uncharacterized protein n=1 Tax=Candidatus Sungiibacteriota bacterium TaxID=2750080 RepID=A0A932YWK3_9BACT|nr:hypothetical protein [Candidatus Sungbacteria bacterium]